MKLCHDTLHEQAQSWKDQYNGGYEKSLAVIQTLDLSRNDLKFVIKNIGWNRGLHVMHVTPYELLRESCSVLLFYCHGKNKEMFAGDSPCKRVSPP